MFPDAFEGLEKLSMATEIEDHTAKCTVCAAYRKQQPKELRISHKIPNRPWETIGCDVFRYETETTFTQFITIHSL